MHSCIIRCIKRSGYELPVSEWTWLANQASVSGCAPPHVAEVVAVENTILGGTWTPEGTRSGLGFRAKPQNPKP